ncbi:hypothetical protein NLI96_g3951 [Meripilus lineatus]|uniref:Uncharacterized protein n=1 Tax=Meripilus lineatus TaxID=2056292 RepID=A0AAD5YKJ5_9APHY|nr:hypothetical protein NLI96_g3951 [Physisporinus lineatus]
MPDVLPSILRKTSRYSSTTLRQSGTEERKRPSASQSGGRSRFASLSFVGSPTYHADLSEDVFHLWSIDFEYDCLAKACGQVAPSASASTPTTSYDLDDYSINYRLKSRQPTLSSKQVQGPRSLRC